ncbi:MAG: hypothetical protein FJW39_24985 [Acidobacteria bacterium]|nr:hypothetical protein [Acidobacteriota bacterium]
MFPTLFLQYSYLQLLDLLTTLAFLLMGVREGNPFVRLILESSPNPIFGLAVVKTAAMALGIYCVRMGKFQLLARINVLFAVVVAWNLVAMILGAVRLGRTLGAV